MKSFFKIFTQMTTGLVIMSILTVSTAVNIVDSDKLSTLTIIILTLVLGAFCIRSGIKENKTFDLTVGVSLILGTALGIGMVMLMPNTVELINNLLKQK